jgi:hypothetical protein
MVVQAHLQADHFTREFDGGEHDAHRQPDRDADDHLLQHHAHRARVVQADHGLVGQGRLRADRDQHGERDAAAHGHRAGREDRRAGEHGEDAQERPEHRRHQRHDVGFTEGEHRAARTIRSRDWEWP